MLQFHVIVEPAEPPWNVTFDEALSAFEQTQGVFCEPDGSFFRASPPQDPKWQVEGNLYDQGECLAYLEMKGSCPEAQLEEFLRPLGWPEVRLRFQLVREGRTVEEAEFRKATFPKIRNPSDLGNGSST